MKKMLLRFWHIATLKLDPYFDAEFKLEFVRTELLRVNLMIGLLTFGLITGTAAVFIIRESEVYGMIYKALGYFLVVMTGILGYEIIARSYILHRLHLKKRLEKWFCVTNLAIEASFPTIIIYSFVVNESPTVAFISPFILFYFLFIMQSILHLNFFIAILTGLVASVEYLLLTQWVQLTFTLSDVTPLVVSETLIAVRVLIIMLCGIAASLIAVEIRRRIIRTYEAINERNRIRQMFGQQVSHEIVEQILKEGEQMMTKRLPVCVMFTDVRDFTPFASTRSPEEVLDYQNKLFGYMISAINKHQGIINQILGDGLMATFGAPFSQGNDCNNAVSAAMEILASTKSASENHLIPATRLGIGLHYGEAITGNIGTELRKQYSIVGNVVIQASRIEQLNKQYHSQMLISRDVFEKVSDHINGESLGPVSLKGEKEPLEIIRIC